MRDPQVPYRKEILRNGILYTAPAGTTYDKKWLLPGEPWEYVGRVGDLSIVYDYDDKIRDFSVAVHPYTPQMFGKSFLVFGYSVSDDSRFRVWEAFKVGGQGHMVKSNGMYSWLTDILIHPTRREHSL